jgi:tetratricopeptide (TPR) repeat protein
VHEEALEGESLARMSTIELVTGNHEEALALARRAVTAASAVASELDRGYTRLAHAQAAAAMGQWDEAETALVEAHRLFETLELDSLVRETTVGLAGVAAARGQVDEAVELIGPVLAHLDATGLSHGWQPGEMLLRCHRILVEARDQRAGAVLEQARTYLRSMSEEVGDPELAAGYLSFPPHAALLDHN